MTCPRPHCGGLLLVDDGEYVCKACARRFTPASLQDAVRAASVALAAVETTSGEASTTRDRLAVLLADDGDDELSDEDETDEEGEEGAAMSERGRCQQPWGRGTCKADAVEGSKFCVDHGGAPKPEARSPKPEARSPKPEARSQGHTLPPGRRRTGVSLTGIRVAA